MLADGAHLSIDGVSYMLAVDEDGPHYQHRYESLFAPTQAIAGEIAKFQIRPEKLLWSLTDWSGGEGALIYYPQNSTQYDQALCMNVTERGQLTTRTKRRRSAVARAGTNADTGKCPAGVSAYSHALIGWEDNIISSADAITWAAAQDATPNMSGKDFYAVVGDGTNAAFLAQSASVPVVSPATAVDTWADTDGVGTTQTALQAGCVVDGLPYTLGLVSGALGVYKKASVMSTTSDWVATLVYATGATPSGTVNTNYWTSATSAETASYWSYSTKTHGFIWEVRADVGRPFYTGPAGFCIKKLIYHEGVLFVLGNQAAAGNSFAMLKAIPLTTREPLTIAEPRAHQNVALDTFSIGCPGMGSTLYVADEDSGKIFVYDMDRNALSLFDDLVNGGAGDGVSFTADTDKIAFLAMHGARLFCATWTPGGAATSLQVISWDDLKVQNRDASQAIAGNLESAEWDFGLPMETKGLIGFYVTFKVTDAATTSGLIANSRITVSYSADDATYVATTTITSATTPTGAKGRVFIAAPTGSNTVKFSRLKVKIALDNNAQAVAPPIVYGVTAEAQPLAYTETWDLVLRVEDETSNERPTTRNFDANTLRDKLNTLVSNKQIVTLLDGYGDRIPNSYNTHTVVVEDPLHDIRDPDTGNGITRIRLRAVT